MDDCSESGQAHLLKELLSNDPNARIYRNTENKRIGYMNRRRVESTEVEIC